MVHLLFVFFPQQHQKPDPCLWIFHIFTITITATITSVGITAVLAPMT